MTGNRNGSYGDCRALAISQVERGVVHMSSLPLPLYCLASTVVLVGVKPISFRSVVDQPEQPRASIASQSNT